MARRRFSMFILSFLDATVDLRSQRGGRWGSGARGFIRAPERVVVYVPDFLIWQILGWTDSAHLRDRRRPSHTYVKAGEFIRRLAD